MKTTIMTLATILMMGSSVSAIASEPPRERPSPEEMAKKKAEWEGMSKEQKLERIEEKRIEFRKEMDAKWNAMSDDEKIKFVEERFDKHKGKHGKRGPRGEGGAKE